MNSARGAARLVADAVRTAASVGADPRRGSLVIVRADSAFYGYDIVAAARRAKARFSLTARATPAVTRAITSIGEEAWVPIRCPHAVADPDTGDLISDAEVAEVPYTAFTARPQSQHVTARLLVRRVQRLHPTTPTRHTQPAQHRDPQAGEQADQQPDQQAAEHGTEQGVLFTTVADYRCHAVFTDSPLPLVEAETTHRAHAVIEQVIADLKNGPLPTCPRDGSPPTPPGSSWRPWPTPSHAPPESSPAGFMPAPARQPSARN